MTRHYCPECGNQMSARRHTAKGEPIKYGIRLRCYYYNCDFHKEIKRRDD